ncbi:MAG: response regulator [Elusimicrobiota bacterium]
MAKKILIADDDQEIIDFLNVTLDMGGYNVISVQHGGQVPAAVKKEKPDLLILDVLMPGLDGYSLMLYLAQQNDTKNIPVIVASALPATRSLFEKFQQVKVFFDKPFDSDKLLDKVREILGE